MKITYIGHSAILIENHKANILIDPYITKNINAGIKIGDLPNIDYILVTHAHDDHIGDTIDIAQKYNATIICISELGSYLAGYNIRVHRMNFGSHTFDFGRVKMVTAAHSSCLPQKEINVGDSVGFVLYLDKTIYHAGDTGLIADMQLLSRENIDLALLPIGGNFTMDVDDAVYAAKLIEAKVVVPIHYNTFPGIVVEDASINRFLDSGINVLIKKPGDTFIL